MAHRYKVIQGGPYPHLITCTITRWLPVFLSEPYFRIIIDSLQHLRLNRNLLVHPYVIMPTHLHALVTAINDDLSAVMRDFKRYTSGCIYEACESEGQDLLIWCFKQAARSDSRLTYKVWQDEFHPKVAMTYHTFLQKAEYIHQNPVRKGFVTNPEHWYYSSAGAYATGTTEPLEVDVLEWES